MAPKGVWMDAELERWGAYRENTHKSFRPTPGRLAVFALLGVAVPVWFAKLARDGELDHDASHGFLSARLTWLPFRSTIESLETWTPPTGRLRSSPKVADDDE